MNLLTLYPYTPVSKFKAIGYGDIAFQRFGGYRKCRHEYSCSSAQVYFNSNITQGGYIYPHIMLYCNVLGIDNVVSP